MVRTVVSLNEDDKRWLDRKAALEGVTMTEIVRRAVRRLRSEEGVARAFDHLLEVTHGIGSGEDGLVTQKRLRSEWKRRSA